jgi:hypothetical protein
MYFLKETFIIYIFRAEIAKSQTESHTVTGCIAMQIELPASEGIY